MTSPNEALVFLLLVACEVARAMEIMADWGDYERGESLRWGLTFTVHEEEPLGVRLAMMDMLRAWATRERAKLGLGPWPDRRVEIEAQYPPLRDFDEPPRPKPRKRGPKPRLRDGWDP